MKIKMPNNPFDAIPIDIMAFWKSKYGIYLMCSQSGDHVIFYENGTLDSFHPSGDKLARHNLKTGQTIYLHDGQICLTAHAYRVTLLLDN